MVIRERKISGLTYLYASISKKDIYLGAKNGEINMVNLDEAISLTDKTFKQALDRYVRDVSNYTSLLDKANARQYSVACSSRLSNYASKLRKIR